MHLDSHLDTVNPDATDMLRNEGVDVMEIAFKLSSTLPNIISLPFNSSASANAIQASVLDMRTGDVNTVASYAEMRRLFDGPQSAAHCVLDVTFAEAAFTKDFLIQKRGYVVDSAVTAAEWLKPGAYLRVLFVGAARDGHRAVPWVLTADAQAEEPRACISRRRRHHL